MSKSTTQSPCALQARAAGKAHEQCVLALPDLNFPRICTFLDALNDMWPHYFRHPMHKTLRAFWQMAAIGVEDR